MHEWAVQGRAVATTARSSVGSLGWNDRSRRNPATSKERDALAE